MSYIAYLRDGLWTPWPTAIVAKTYLRTIGIGWKPLEIGCHKEATRGLEFLSPLLFWATPARPQPATSTCVLLNKVDEGGVRRMWLSSLTALQRILCPSLDPVKCLGSACCWFCPLQMFEDEWGTSSQSESLMTIYLHWTVSLFLFIPHIHSYQKLSFYL